MAIQVIPLNEEHPDLKQVIIEAVRAASLEPGDHLVIVALPKGDDLGDHYLPPDAAVPSKLAAKLAGWGVPADGRHEYIFLRHKPLAIQMVQTFLHEYRHHWQHQVLQADVILEARRHNWVQCCDRCRPALPEGYLPVEADAEVFAYRTIKRHFGDKRRADTLFGVHIPNSDFFRFGLDQSEDAGPEQLQREVQTFSRSISRVLAYHAGPKHQTPRDLSGGQITMQI